MFLFAGHFPLNWLSKEIFPPLQNWEHPGSSSVTCTRKRYPAPEQIHVIGKRPTQTEHPSSGSNGWLTRAPLSNAVGVVIFRNGLSSGAMGRYRPAPADFHAMVGVRASSSVWWSERYQGNLPVDWKYRHSCVLSFLFDYVICCESLLLSKVSIWSE